jgi:hypothetical protein
MCTSENVQVVHVPWLPISPVMVALKAFPPTTWWRWADGVLPGSTTGSRRWIVTVEHPNRRAAWEDPTRAPSAREREDHFILRVRVLVDVNTRDDQDQAMQCAGRYVCTRSDFISIPLLLASTSCRCHATRHLRCLDIGHHLSRCKVGTRTGTPHPSNYPRHVGTSKIP